jgi:uncharacterized tellurite resistance protein B-like protein
MAEISISGDRIMLKDRRVLLEQELTQAHDAAAMLYLKIVTTDGDVASSEYQALKDRITSLQFDLNVVNKLIYKGHK